MFFVSWSDSINQEKAKNRSVDKRFQWNEGNVPLFLTEIRSALIFFRVSQIKIHLLFSWLTPF